MEIVLIAGLWLDGSAWDDVVPALEALGHRPVPLTLPGQGDGSASAELMAVDATASTTLRPFGRRMILAPLVSMSNGFEPKYS